MASRRLGVLVVLAISLALLAACSSSQSGSGNGSAVAGSPLASLSAGSDSDSAVVSASAPPSSAPAPASQTTQQAPPPATKSSAPQPVSSTNKANPGPFAGDWKGSGKTLEVSGDESANVTYLVGVPCGTASTTPSPCDSDTDTPGGFAMLHITMVVTTGTTAVAYAQVRSSDDPKHPEGTTVTFTLKGGVISSVFGAFAKV